MDRLAVWRSAVCARVAYSDYTPEGRCVALQAFGMTVLSEAPNGAGFCAQNEHETIIAFPGTECFTDLAIDGDIACVGDPLVHAGFRHSWDASADWFDETLARVNPVHLVLTGHSKGAAVATQAAYYRAGHVDQVITFGSPRCGLRAFVDAYNRVCSIAPTTRIVHARDVVPTMPIWPFEHVCPEIRLDDQGNEIASTGLGADASQAAASLDGCGLMEHGMTTYLAAVKAWAAKVAA